MFHRVKFWLYLNRLLCGILALFATACQSPVGWAVYYGDQTPPSELEQYGLVVLDRLYPFSIKKLQENGTQVMVYISLGEVTVNDPWYDYAKENNLLLEENPNWKGSYVVDIRNPLWQELVLKQILPPLIAYGFDGVMMDTLDSPLALEKDKAGMEQAAVQLVTEIRHAYPELILIQNRGYTILEQTAALLNYTLAESTFTNYDTTQEKYILREAAEQEYALKFIRKAEAQAPAMRILGLEYWDPADKMIKSQLTKKMCQNKMLPFISTRSLTQLHP